MEQGQAVALTHASIVFYNVGPSKITIDDVEVDPGEQVQFTVFKGVDRQGDVRSGKRSFRANIVDLPDFRIVTGEEESIPVVKVAPL